MTKEAGGRRALSILRGSEVLAVVALLSPIGPADLDDADLVRCMTRWRAQNAEAFASRFHVTDQGTDSWLREQVIGNPDRILFLIKDLAGLPVGHLGLVLHDSGNLSVELDAVLRGEPAPGGTMRAAVRAMEAWSETQLGISEIWLRVLASNLRALRFYEHLGYVETWREPLTAVHEDGVTRLAPGREPAADEFVTMVRMSV